MPTTRLIQARSYFDPAELDRLDRVRKTRLRRVSRSRFIADCAMREVERLEQSGPTHEQLRRRKTA